jgi:hypothetical protein
LLKQIFSLEYFQLAFSPIATGCLGSQGWYDGDGKVPLEAFQMKWGGCIKRIGNRREKSKQCLKKKYCTNS